MKNRNNINQRARLTDDSHNRLIAYTTAAGLGAFFAGHSVEAAVVESAALAPYPHTLVPGAGTGYYHTYFYLDIDGNGTPDFNLNVSSMRVNIAGFTGNLALNPSPNGYLIPWTVGTTVNNTGSAPTYKSFLANKYFNNFSTPEALGFKFTSSISGSPETYFGYMDIQVQGSVGNFTATVDDIYWNNTPNTGITVGPVPEPTSLALLAAGVAGMVLRRARRDRRK